MRFFESWLSRETNEPGDLLHFAVPKVEWLECFRATCPPRRTVLYLMTRHIGTGLRLSTPQIPFFNCSYWESAGFSSLILRSQVPRNRFQRSHLHKLYLSFHRRSFSCKNSVLRYVTAMTRGLDVTL